jgi:hypothetical protein
VSAAKKKRGGRIPFVAMATDPGFQRNARMALEHPERLRPGLREVLERYLANPLKAAAEDAQLLLNDLRQFRQGRPESAATAHIRQLVTDNPTLAHKPTALYKLRDRSIIKSMTMPSWRNRVAEVRRK